MKTMMVDVVLAVSVQNAVEGPGADLKPSQTGVYIIFNFKIIKKYLSKPDSLSQQVTLRASSACPPLLMTVCLIWWNLSFGTPLFKGHLHSEDTKFGPGKIVIT